MITRKEYESKEQCMFCKTIPGLGVSKLCLNGKSAIKPIGWVYCEAQTCRQDIWKLYQPFKNAELSLNKFQGQEICIPYMTQHPHNIIINDNTYKNMAMIKHYIEAMDL